MMRMVRAASPSVVNRHPPQPAADARLRRFERDEVSLGISKALETIGPNLRCLPDRVVGMPVALAILRLAAEIPVARFQENDRPGIPVLLRRRVIEASLEQFAVRYIAIVLAIYLCIINYIRMDFNR